MRFHTNLPVRDIAKTVDFYRVLFSSDPVKLRDDYAKFLPDGIALNLSFHLSAAAVEPLRDLHLGIELPDQAAVDEAFSRLQAAGLVSEPRQTSVCCYANQDKFWVEDPNGYRWELYWLVNDASYKIEPSSGCCNAAEPTEAAGRSACC